MKKITIFVATLIFVNICKSKPLSEGLEYRCITTAIHRIVGNKMEEINVPLNTKPFYIVETNNTLTARYREPNMPEVSYNNATLLKIDLREDQGRKFDVAFFIKNRKDSENDIRIFKELNVKTKHITMTTISKYSETPGALRMIHYCE